MSPRKDVDDRKSHNLNLFYTKALCFLTNYTQIKNQNSNSHGACTTDKPIFCFGKAVIRLLSFKLSFPKAFNPIFKVCEANQWVCEGDFIN